MSDDDKRAREEPKAIEEKKPNTGSQRAPENGDDQKGAGRSWDAGNEG